MALWIRIHKIKNNEGLGINTIGVGVRAKMEPIKNACVLISR